MRLCVRSSEGPSPRDMIIYRACTRVFKDASGDGVGDFDGIIEKLDHFAGSDRSLGVNTILLTPIYKPGGAEDGTDASDLEDADPAFGGGAAFSRLASAAKDKGLRTVLELIPTHTSIAHPWFQASRRGETDPKRNWYIWHKARIKGIPPNNWLDENGASAWKFDPISGDYYLASYGRETADLNWRHTETRDAIFAAMHTWIRRGADGFMTEGSIPLLKDPSFQNDPVNPGYDKENDPSSARYLRVHSHYPHPLDTGQTFCEAFGRNKLPNGADLFICMQDVERLFLPCAEPMHSPFTIRLSRIPWNAHHYRHFIDTITSATSPEENIIYVFAGRETLRPATLLGPHRARLIPLLLLTLRGIPIITYGDEIGMQNIEAPTSFSEHHARWTPMQWDASPYAGFSRVAPPFPLVSNFHDLNVETERSMPRSMFALYQKLIALRKRTKALAYGSYWSIDMGSQPIFAYMREHEKKRILVAMNFSPVFQLARFRYPSGKLLATTELDQPIDTPVNPQALPLRPYEGCVVELS